MSNRLRAAVDDYLEEVREYERDVEAEIAQIKRDAQTTRTRTQRAMIAALYWRAGEMLVRAVEFADVPRATLHYTNEASALIGAAQRLEALL